MFAVEVVVYREDSQVRLDRLHNDEFEFEFEEAVDNSKELQVDRDPIVGIVCPTDWVDGLVDVIPRFEMVAVVVEVHSMDLAPPDVV